MEASSSFIVGLFLVGIVAVIIEMFIPGLVLGLAGLCCMIAAVALAYTQESKLLGHVLLASSLAAAPVLCFLCVTVCKRIATLRMRNEATVTPEGRDELLGKAGVALTQLRPSGTARIDGQRVDVMARGEIIEANTRIEVIVVEGNRVVVRELRA